MSLVRHLTLVLLFIAAPALVGQTPDTPATNPAPRQDELDIPRSSDPGKQPLVREFIADEIQIWTSPFRKSSYSSRGFTRYVIPFTLITGALLATDHRTAELLPNTEDQSTWSLRVSQIGAPYSLAGMAAGMYLISRATGNKKARETGFLGAAAIGHSQLVTLGLKTMSKGNALLSSVKTTPADSDSSEAAIRFHQATPPVPLRSPQSLLMNTARNTSGFRTYRME